MAPIVDLCLSHGGASEITFNDQQTLGYDGMRSLTVNLESFLEDRGQVSPKVQGPTHAESAMGPPLRVYSIFASCFVVVKVSNMIVSHTSGSVTPFVSQNFP